MFRNDDADASQTLEQADQDTDVPADTPAPDSLSQKGAIALAKRLQDYWHGRGYPAVRFWTEPVGERFSKVGTYELYRVACNLVNGNPPQYREEPTSRGCGSPKN